MDFRSWSLELLGHVLGLGLGAVSKTVNSVTWQAMLSSCPHPFAMLHAMPSVAACCCLCVSLPVSLCVCLRLIFMCVLVQLPVHGCPGPDPGPGPGPGPGPEPGPGPGPGAKFRAPKVHFNEFDMDD